MAHSPASGLRLSVGQGVVVKLIHYGSVKKGERGLDLKQVNQSYKEGKRKDADGPDELA